MIIDFHKCYGGGGSGSGVTPQEVQAQIDSALTPYWDSAATESAITEALSGISLDGYYTSAQTDEKIASAVTPVSEHLFDVEQVTASALTELHDGLLEVSARTVDMSGYYTSAQTEDAISAATSGKADAANVSARTSAYDESYLPAWNEQGVITGDSGQRIEAFQIGFNDFYINSYRDYIGSGAMGMFYAPDAPGNAGDILVSRGEGNGAPVWSAVTMPDMSEYTPTSGFSTINGSAITNGGNIVIQGGGGDMSNYWNSAQTKSYVDSAATNLQDQIDTMDDVVAAALVDLNDRVDEISGSTQDMVTSTDVRHIVKLTQAQYDQLATKDPDTFYIIVNSN